MIVGDPFFRDKLLEGSGINVVPDELVLEVSLPVHLHGPRDVAHLIEDDVLVGLHDANPRVIQMLRNPLRRHQNFWIGIFHHSSLLPSSDRISGGRLILK